MKTAVTLTPPSLSPPGAARPSGAALSARSSSRRTSSSAASSATWRPTGRFAPSAPSTSPRTASRRRSSATSSRTSTATCSTSSRLNEGMVQSRRCHRKALFFIISLVLFDFHRINLKAAIRKFWKFQLNAAVRGSARSSAPFRAGMREGPRDWSLTNVVLSLARGGHHRIPPP